ncbi:MAG: hypothetical protein ABIJ35_04420, partial [Acidobacteriota bacterium]
MSVSARTIDLQFELMIKMPGSVELREIIDNTEFTVSVFTILQLLSYPLAIGNVNGQPAQKGQRAKLQEGELVSDPMTPGEILLDCFISSRLDNLPVVPCNLLGELGGKQVVVGLAKHGGWIQSQVMTEPFVGKHHPTVTVFHIRQTREILHERLEARIAFSQRLFCLLALSNFLLQFEIGIIQFLYVFCRFLLTLIQLSVQNIIWF